MSEQWYVLNVKPHKERTVYNYLQSRNLNVYFPRYRVDPVNPRAAKVRPYFPGYMFVNINLDDEGDNALRWTPGTRGLVRFGNEPATVPDNLIHELRKRLSLMETMKERQNRLEPGDRVRIVNGPFAGYEAIFDTRLSGKDRVQVLLAYLHSRPQRLNLNVNDLEKVS